MCEQESFQLACLARVAAGLVAVEDCDFKSLSTKKQTTKFSPANFQQKKMLSPSYIILRIRRLDGKQYRSRWGGPLWGKQYRSRWGGPHQDLRYLQI